MEKFILALDQGTTGTTLCLLDRHAKVTATYAQEHPQIYPQPGWVEHDADRIWATVVEGVGKLLTRANIGGEQIAAIGITNQRETVVMWDRRTRRPIHNAIVWQCRRTTAFCAKTLKPIERQIKSKTGLVVDPYFSASKIRWLLDHVPGARRQVDQLQIGTIDSFLLFNLSGGQTHRTDVSNASRTQLMNIKKGSWDPELLKVFRIPASLLPEIVPSNGTLGKTRGVPGLPDGIPIAGMAGDQQAALFGQMCFHAGAAKCTFGTGSFLLMNTGAEVVRSNAGLLSTVAWQLESDAKLTYALEGGAFICGAAVQWLRDQMQFFKTSAEVETLAREVTSTDGVYLVPAFVGLGAPYWDPAARAALVGMTRGTTRAHLARAALEAMALQNVEILNAMARDLGRKLKRLRVDGGAVQDDLLMQMQADFLGVPVERPRQVESTVLGAAYLAGLGVGFWPDRRELERTAAIEREFQPEMSTRARREKLAGWQRAVVAARSF